MNSRKIILDLEGDNITPPGYEVVVDPVGLLEYSRENIPLHVKGPNLCAWVEVIAEGRGWQVTRTKSPLVELREICPTLSQDEARDLISELENKIVRLKRPLQLTEVLETLYEDVNLWAEEPGIPHAFGWLCWLAEQSDIGSKRKLVYELAQYWRTQVEQPLKLAYSARSHTEAWPLLMEWLKIHESKHSWPTPPRTSLKGNLKKRQEEEFIRQAVDTCTDSFSAILDRSPKKELLKMAAHACANVLLKNSREITIERLQRLEKYLSHDIVLKLNKLVEPEDPGFPIWEFDQLKAWFTGKYLPYREWTYQLGKTGKSVRYTATEFARQYLDYYISARVGGEGSEHFAWAKTTRLRETGQDLVSILVVLDGLTYPDAQRLIEQIENESDQFSLNNKSIALGPLPTVTEFAKPAVSSGMLPSDAIEAITPTYNSPDALGKALVTAVPGDVLVWSFLEPDRTYHWRADAGSESVRLEVDAQLSTIAKFIISVVEKTPSEMNIRIIITTDHGRLLLNSERTKTIPSGMKAHGRAAWGSSDVLIGKNGYLVDEDIIYLDAVRFGLPKGQAYAAIASDQTFLTSDGRKGNEPFPHGGLSPEEVLIPWFEFTRGRALIHLDVELNGKGEEGKSEKGILIIRNSSDVHIKVTALTCKIIGMTCPIEADIGPFQKREIDIIIPNWPSKLELSDLFMSLKYLLPDGQPVEHKFQPNLEAESIYEKPDILSEFEGL
ncbi:MAG: hypothetical protein QGD96_13260 [Anaerolineae bacterium]|nr:hypothetical protein [Anaerolineae bacterium]